MSCVTRAATVLLGLGGLLLSSPSMAQPPQAAWRGQLRAADSDRCLADSGSARVRHCERAPVLSLMPAHGGQVYIRDDARNACLFSNRDGRFGWSGCNPQFDDQRWRLEGIRGGPGRPGHRMRIVAAHSGKCLFSNHDGRFGVYNCNAAWGDQLWRLTEVAQPLPPPPVQEVPAAGASIEGGWHWADGAHTFMRRDGTFTTANDRVGHWRPRHRGPGFVVEWGGGRRAEVMLSPDGEVLSGTLFFNGRSEPVRARRGHGGPPPGPVAPPAPRPMDPGSFHQLAHAIKAESFSRQKLDVLRSAAVQNGFTCAQVGRLIDLYTFGNDKVEAVRITRPHIVDPQNGFTLSSHFTFSSNKEQVQRMFQ